MKLHLGRLSPLFALVLVLSACEGVGLPHTSGGHSPSASSPATDDPQRCVRLAKRGFTPCPPPAARLALPPTTIRNATGGAVSDATAQQWGRAFQLAQAYYYWALSNRARGAFTSGSLADSSPTATSNLYSNDLMDLDEAARQQGAMIIVPLRM